MTFEQKSGLQGTPGQNSSACELPSSLISVAVANTMTKSNLGEERVYPAYAFRLRSIVPGMSRQELSTVSPATSMVREK